MNLLSSSTAWSFMESMEKQLESASQLITSGSMEDTCKTFGLTYVTPRLMCMGFPPCTTTSKSPNLKVVDPRLCDYLQKKHQDRFMVWNLSEVSYEGLSAIEFRFPGHPSAPLGSLFELCTSLDSWLNADPENVALLHCLTGRGRTITVTACYLAWAGFNHFSAQQALQFVCDQRKVKVLEATIPSQRRYVEYFSRAMDGVRPRTEAIMLKSAKAFGVPQNSLLQAYVDGNLVFSGKAATAIATEGGGDEDHQVVSFPAVNSILDGDVLIRIRVEDAETKKRVSLLRVALHSGYTPSGRFRLERGDLDGGSATAWLELEFEPIPGTQSAAKLIARGVATSESAFWELIAKRRNDLRSREVEDGHQVFAIVEDENDDEKNALEQSNDDFKSEEDDLEKELGLLLEGNKKPAVVASPTTTMATTPTVLLSPASQKLVSEKEQDDDMEELDEYFKGLE